MFDGMRIKKLRQDNHLSRERFANIIDVGVAMIYRYEKGDNVPSGDVILRMAKAFNVSADYLLGLVDNPNPRSIEELDKNEVAALSAWRRGDVKTVIKAILIDSELD